MSLIGLLLYLDILQKTLCEIYHINSAQISKGSRTQVSDSRPPIGNIKAAIQSILHEATHFTIASKNGSNLIMLDPLHHFLIIVLLGVQAQVPRHQTALSAPFDSGLGIYDAISALRRLHQFRVLFFEDLEVALGFPVPDGVGGEDEVHLLEGTLVRFGVKSPDDDDRGGVDGAEQIESLFVERCEDCGKQEDLAFH